MKKFTIIEEKRNETQKYTASKKMMERKIQEIRTCADTPSIQTQNTNRKTIYNSQSKNYCGHNGRNKPEQDEKNHQVERYRRKQNKSKKEKATTTSEEEESSEMSSEESTYQIGINCEEKNSLDNQNTTRECQ